MNSLLCGFGAKDEHEDLPRSLLQQAAGHPLDHLPWDKHHGGARGWTSRQTRSVREARSGAERKALLLFGSGGRRILEIGELSKF